MGYWSRKRYYEKKKKLGVCVFCDNEPVKGTTMCQHHLDLQKKYRKKHAKKLQGKKVKGLELIKNEEFI